ncbi:hypothetical protein PGT21_018713 [Puccinia graminis f. sp. tritici]|uniref:Uncharacterized protein n=1 Tax=Puccinia graminis f. sp. tritici TaxID=56615 RepID=A0A5B0PGB4_PUCGR|nr:hypothetical protein PGTUg99_028833 [Puccinia graminis f. sp. tritici]KAA1099730.1 hypothetical protein PGT21_018713 [Puccinia graminis f. sp. tritici]
MRHPGQAWGAVVVILITYLAPTICVSRRCDPNQCAQAFIEATFRLCLQQKTCAECHLARPNWLCTVVIAGVTPRCPEHLEPQNFIPHAVCDQSQHVFQTCSEHSRYQA